MARLHGAIIFMAAMVCLAAANFDEEVLTASYDDELVQKRAPSVHHLENAAIKVVPTEKDIRDVQLDADQWVQNKAMRRNMQRHAQMRQIEAKIDKESRLKHVVRELHRRKIHKKAKKHDNSQAHWQKAAVKLVARMKTAASLRHMKQRQSHKEVRDKNQSKATHPPPSKLGRLVHRANMAMDGKHRSGRQHGGWQKHTFYDFERKASSERRRRSWRPHHHH